MNDGLIPRRYAKALYKLALENGDSEQTYEMLKSFNFQDVAIDELKRTMINPHVSDEEKQRLLRGIIGAKNDSSLDKFLLLVLRKNRADQLRLIALAYLDLYRQEHNISKVVITTAAQLPEPEIEAILDVVKKRMGDTTLEVYKETDPDLIGGFTIKIDDLLLDASVKNELKQMRVELMKANKTN